MSYGRSTNIGRVLAALAVCAALAGCSNYYFDRRDTVSMSAGDAHASNRVTHMVDPWPRASGNRNIAFNGQTMQAAVERYRRGKVTRPVNATTSSASYGAPPLVQVAPTSVSSGTP